jgi:MYXO-CTERM domain-containing protein
LHFEGALQSLTSSSTQAVSSDVTAPAVLGLLALGLMGFSRRKIN